MLRLLKALAGAVWVLSVVVYAEQQKVCSADGVCEIEDVAASIPVGANAAGTPRAVDRDCYDRHEVCKDWAAQGECIVNPGILLECFFFAHC
jgi:hypothetical protein